MKIINKPEKIDFKKWSDYVYNHAKGNIFQTPEMFHVYKQTKNYKPKITIAFEKEKIVGVLLSVIQKEYKSLPGLFTTRCIVFGGPLVDNKDPNIIEKILQAHNEMIKNKAIYSQFRNLFYLKDLENIFSKFGYHYEPHLDIHIDLNQNIEQYWDTRKSKLRQKIRKAKKNNIDFNEIHSENELRQAYAILEEVYDNAKLPLPDFSLFQNAFKILKDEPNKYVAFFKAEKGDQMIGTRFVLLFRNTIYDWYAGSKKEFYKYYPNDFLPYKVLEWGMNDQNYDIFYFGGAGKPNVPYGVRDHKLKFGNNLVELGRFEKIHQPVLYKIAKLGFYIYQLLK